MAEDDRYSDIAEYYDHMLGENPEREEFFREIFQMHNVRNILDCACGTGSDLILFNSLGYSVTGSDISESMLKVAQQKIADCNADITLKKVDFHNLNKSFKAAFDAVVCLSNAVNEIDVDVIRALESMKSVLNKDGIIIFDQGQTDFTMKDPHAYFPAVNNKDLSRLFTMSYIKEIMDVNIFDFIHKENEGIYDFKHSAFKIRIRLHSDWVDIMRQVGLEADFYGNWSFEPYDKEKSKRLIVVARNGVN